MIQKEELMRNNQVFADTLEKQVTVVEIKGSTASVFIKDEGKVIEVPYTTLYPLPLIKSRLIDELGLVESNNNGKLSFLKIIDENKSIYLRIDNPEDNSEITVTLEIPGEGELAKSKGILYVHQLQNFIKSTVGINFLAV